MEVVERRIYMTSTDAAETIRAFFESYRRAFERFDASAIADHFVFPGHITADSKEIGLTSVTDRPAWIGQLDRLLGMYRAIDVASARVVELMITELSPRLFQAIVHWALDDRAGRRLYDFEAAYTLAEVGDALRITAIAHNEIPRYRECVARLRAEGAGGARSEPDAAV
jgi:hypothetical protein